MATTTDTPDMFTELPLEVLREICQRLDLCNKLKLRTVFKKDQEDIVVDLIGPALKTLYVSPTEVSIRHFEGITASEFFRKHITTLMYMPYVIAGDKPAMTLEEYRESCRGKVDDNGNSVYLTGAELRRSFAMYRELHEQHRGYQNYDDPETSSRLLGALVPGLARLSRLRKLTVTGTHPAEGLDASCLFYDEDHVERRMKAGFYTLEQDKLSNMANDIIWQSWPHGIQIMANTDMMFKAIERTGPQIREFTIGGLKEFDSLGYDLTYLGHAVSHRTIQSALRHVQDLTICVHNSHNGVKPQLPSASKWQKIAARASGVQSLTMLVPYDEEYDEGDEDESEAYGKVVNHFLERDGYQYLRSLHLQAESNKLGWVRKDLFQEFLHSHSSVLREVVLVDIVTVLPTKYFPNDMPPRKLLKDGMRSTLKDISNIPFDVFTMKIECWAGEHDNGNRLDWGDEQPKVFWFEELATELNVQLSEDGWEDGKKGWNFGEAVAKVKKGLA